jgi:prefoldin subunit 5
MATLRGTVEDEQRIDKQIERLETSICQLAERVEELTEALEQIRQICFVSDDDISLQQIETLVNVTLKNGRGRKFREA